MSIWSRRMSSIWCLRQITPQFPARHLALPQLTQLTAAWHWAVNNLTLVSVQLQQRPYPPAGCSAAA